MGLLDISDVRVLEDMVIECIYSGLLSGRLDNKNQQMTVDYVSSRDFKAEDTTNLFDKLNRWKKHVEEIEGMLDKSLRSTMASLEANERRKKEVKVKADETYSKALVELENHQMGRKQEGKAKGFGRMIPQGDVDFN
eukprot:TRINITY_DN5056_c0_g1_i3.p2 TRINITY_DN5056_c0_g1~~TRINITY_DN5056_c0_g1_i3.p2  ORF type:complete len:137 (+),score=59.43 TRINITY_DN5056_c0_g1_i3:571-981(+)